MKKRLSRSRILPTDDTGVQITANTKYLSQNPISRYLIREFMRSLTEIAGALGPVCVLDVGCGEGLVLRQMRLHWQEIFIQGIDIDFVLLPLAKKIAPSAHYAVADVCHMPLPDACYDLVIATEMLEHLKDPHSGMQEITRVGRGYFLLSVPNEPWWRIANMLRGKYLTDFGNTPTHYNHWNKRDFIMFIGRYMDVQLVRNPFPWTVVLGKART